MALTTFQIEVLQCLAANRSPNSVFAGGAVANRDGPRRSRDLDIEHASARAVQDSFEADSKTLIGAGFKVEKTRGGHLGASSIEAVVSKDGDSVLLDWTHDTAVRFFPAIKDPLFGWRLHDADLALNKLLALAGRRAPRDYYDVVRLHGLGFPIAALAWAAMGKDGGMTPDLVLDEAARNSSYANDVLARELDLEEPADSVELKRQFLAALNEARDVIAVLKQRLPGEVGRLALDAAGGVVVPDTTDFEEGRMTFHEASIGGAWPVVAGNPEP